MTTDRDSRGSSRRRYAMKEALTKAPFICGSCGAEDLRSCILVQRDHPKTPAWCAMPVAEYTTSRASSWRNSNARTLKLKQYPDLTIDAGSWKIAYTPPEVPNSLSFWTRTNSNSRFENLKTDSVQTLWRS